MEHRSRHILGTAPERSFSVILRPPYSVEGPAPIYQVNACYWLDADGFDCRTHIAEYKGSITRQIQLLSSADDRCGIITTLDITEFSE